MARSFLKPHHDRDLIREELLRELPHLTAVEVGSEGDYVVFTGIDGLTMRECHVLAMVVYCHDPDAPEEARLRYAARQAQLEGAETAARASGHELVDRR